MEPYKLPAFAENDLVKTSHNMIEVNPFNPLTAEWALGALIDFILGRERVKTHPSGQKYNFQALRQGDRKNRKSVSCTDNQDSSNIRHRTLTHAVLLSETTGNSGNFLYVQILPKPLRLA